MKIAIKNFLSTPTGVSSVQRGASGELVSWVENGCALSVTRKPAENLVLLKLEVQNYVAQDVLFFDGSGRYLGTQGDLIPTAMDNELQLAGPAGSSFPGGAGGAAPTIASLSALLNAGTVADRATFRDAGRISTFAGTVADTAALIAITNPLRVGDVVQVGSGTGAADYRLIALPASTLSNWRNLGTTLLDGTGKINPIYIPDIALVQYLGSVASQAAMLALTGQQGDWCTRSDTGTNFLLIGSPASTLSNWVQLSGVASAVQSVAGKTGVVTLVKGDVGLGSVDNTPDADKPVSTAQAAAIAKKSDVVNASPVVAAGVTSLTRTAVTTVGAEAPTGYYNRPLLSDHSLTVNVTGAVAGDAIMVLNTAASAITLTAGSLVVTIPAGKSGEIAYNGSAFVDAAPVTGTTYTDAQALAAAVLSGALGASTTQAPTHKAVSDAISAAGGVKIIKFPEVLDAGSGVTAETILWEGTFSNLAGGAEIDFPIRITGTGTTTKAINIKVNGTAGTPSGTLLWGYADSNPIRRVNPSLRLSLDRTSLIGVSGTLASTYGGALAANSHPVMTGLTPGADIRVQITSAKTTATDVVNFYGSARVFG